MTSPKRIVIVGGGIAGLSTAFYLQKFAEESHLPIHITLLEASPRLGGILHTRFEDGYLIEDGPDAFLSENPAILDLCQDLNLTDELIPTQEKNRRSFICSGNLLHPVPKGFYLMTPTDWNALWNLPSISFLGKLRMALEIFIPAKRDSADESVGDFVVRRFGREAFEKLAEPMLGGIYSADLFQLSIQSAFPKFKELEKKFGSVFLGYLREKRLKSTGDFLEASGPRYSLFLSFKQGMSTLIEALEKKINHHTIKDQTRVTGIERQGETWKIVKSTGEIEEADAVCLAVPASIASRLLHFARNEVIARSPKGLATQTEVDPSFGGEAISVLASISQDLAAIPYESIAVVNLAYDQPVISKANEGFGFVVPKTESSLLLGCSFSSLKFSGRAPQGKTLLRAFVGRNAYQELKLESDDAFAKIIAQEIQKILKISTEPVKTWVMRYAEGLPQYKIGHRDRVEKIEAQAKSLPGLYLTGNAYRGIGIPDTVSEAKKNAAQLIKDFNHVCV